MIPTEVPMGLFSSISLKPGDDAPDFTLKDQAGRLITLASLRGKRVVLYFYPKAGTPGCTKEACSFRDAPRFPPDVVVLGVSKDSVDAQKKFSEKNRLSFPLLADSDGTVIVAYGVDGLFGFAKRKTFLIDSKGKVAKVIEDVHSAMHAAEVGEALKAVR
jgi:thioredoxin-dependent peroxiredoxin